MYSKTVDVAAIMRKIKAEAIPQTDSIEDDSFECLNDQIRASYREMERIQSFIGNTSSTANPYLDMGMRIPSFTRFPKFIRGFFVLLTRCVRKATLFMTREQSVVNHSAFDCIKAITENEHNLLHAIKSLEKELRVIKEKYDITQSQLDALKIEIDKKASLEGGIFDEMDYIMFENKFRGTKEDITKRLYYYLNNYVLNKIILNSTILDLGCGRGEWLALLKENGYSPIGVDLNEKMALYCQMNDLNVISGDCIEYLNALPNNSVDLISGFQLIEHLSMMQISQLFTESARVLKSGGMIIFETPNAKNVEVSAYNFYVDPTHKHPLHEDLMEFLAKKKGFLYTEIVHWKQEEIDDWWRSITSSDTTNVLDSETIRTIGETIRSNFYVAPDYALIAIK